jgi:hypothetical protein
MRIIPGLWKSDLSRGHGRLQGRFPWLRGWRRTVFFMPSRAESSEGLTRAAAARSRSHRRSRRQSLAGGGRRRRCHVPEPQEPSRGCAGAGSRRHAGFGKAAPALAASASTRRPARLRAGMGEYPGCKPAHQIRPLATFSSAEATGQGSGLTQVPHLARDQGKIAANSCPIPAITKKSCAVLPQQNRSG